MSEQGLMMLQGKVESLETEVITMRDQVKEMHTALLGGFNGEAGTLHYMRNVVEDVQVVEREHRETRGRVEKLEGEGYRVKGMIAGVGAVVGGLCGALGTWLANHLWPK